MSDLAIRVDSLSKAYRIGLREEIPDTLLGAAKGVLSAPWRNWRRLRRLSTYGAATVDRPSSLTTDNCQLSTAPGGVDSCQLTVDSPPSLPTANCQLSTATDEPDTIWALKDVSFDVREGEVVGVIGRNGAGKSTLLKILSRITEPTRGRAELRGRVSSLLEVGTGFHQELTGRENVYMNGTILGMTKREIDRKFEEIVDFSGVEKFLDTPVKRYSSGMKVRLAFAVAAHLEPEILIIDEVLAVGDAEFQRKCLGKMQDVARGGRTVLFVSHNMAAVQNLCQSAVVLSEGMVVFRGNADAGVVAYLQLFGPSRATADLIRAPRKPGLTAAITHVELRNEDGATVNTVAAMRPLTIRIHYEHSSTLVSPRFGIIVENELGQALFFLQTDVQQGQLPDLERRGAVECHVPSLPLIPGRYYLSVGCSTRRVQLDKVERACFIDVVEADVFGTGILPPRTHGPFLVDAVWLHGSDERVAAQLSRTA